MNTESRKHYHLNWNICSMKCILACKQKMYTW
uniref:Uncharacterized protein n=1 Tax=Anguilla anguilla TaxID=7936 RepID=A0A0E9V5C1_ANGAN